MWKRILFLVGLLLCAYPFISHSFTEREQTEIIEEYEKQIATLEDYRIQECLEQARQYNEDIHTQTEQEYEMELNLLENGMMGRIEIPKISVSLPIYHGTEAEALEKGVGHVYGSSLPVGEENTHCLLAGHRGLPNAEMFARLNELKEGDLFYLHVCEETFIYEVFQIQVVEPENTDVVQVQSGKDLVSLVTCTPYGLNTHRLIVTGERKEDI